MFFNQASSISKLAFILRLTCALVVALLLCRIALGLMPSSCRPNALVLRQGSWLAENNSSSPIPIKTGFTLHSQLGEKIECCSGSYLFVLSRESFKAVSESTLLPALYLPAIGGKFTIKINGTDLKIPDRKDYSSVGPLIPLHADFFSSDAEIVVKLDDVPTAYNGLWKAPPLIGDYFELSEYQQSERRTQVLLPVMNGIALFLFSFLFLFLYIVSQKQAKFFLSVAIGFSFYAVFDFYLSGSVRAVDLYFGFVTHYPMRALLNIGTFILVISFFEMISDYGDLFSVKSIKVTYGLLITLALIILILGITKHWEYTIWFVAISFIIPFWPLFKWPLRKSVATLSGFISLVVVLFAFITTSFDAFKLVS